MLSIRKLSRRWPKTPLANMKRIGQIAACVYLTSVTCGVASGVYWAFKTHPIHWEYFAFLFR